jgi:hypothetical protein
MKEQLDQFNSLLNKFFLRIAQYKFKSSKRPIMFLNISIESLF